MRKSDDTRLPLVLACSGCSKNAQTANDLARVMDAEGFAKLTTSVNLINTEPNWVNEVRLGRAILLIDGCDKCCMHHLLSTYHIAEDWHVNLCDYGFNQTIEGLLGLSQLNSAIRAVQSILSSARK